MRISDFEKLPSVFPEILVWGFHGKGQNYVVSYNLREPDDGYKLSYRRTVHGLAVGPTQFPDRHFDTLESVAEFISLHQLGGL